ncbi:DUF4349 domain-containing protein [Halorussus lipolyticus]|uniref:DUF4349 domain-containing protein n=1 Tax=Halorussus lipolyticus TaxID=3034024 RepID=UPI0023E7A6BD|nr:DUF4349 domain-containing protein [Halorussus sp. DT80]
MARERRRLLVAVALAVLLVLAGCSGSSGGDAMSATAGDKAEETGAQRQDASKGGPNADSAGGGSANFQASQRALIRTGTVVVEVDDYDAVRRNLSRETRRRGGFVSDSTEQVNTWGNQSWSSGKLVLRVPKDNFSALVSQAKQSGEVREASTSTRDVTKKLVDIEARLKNLQAQREKLRTLYDEANDTETVLEVQERLSEVQSEIEQLEAQRKSLNRQVAYSTLTVRLEERPPKTKSTDDAPSAWYETGLLSAFASSAHGVVVVTRGLAVGLAYALPYVLAFGIPVVGVVALWRRRKSGSSTGEDRPDAPESPQSRNAGDSSDEDDD